MADGLFVRAIDFTDRDFESWRLRLRALAQAAYPGWTDYNRANIGNLMLELFAMTLDVISYTQDQQVNETRVSYAQQRKSMIELGRNVGFELPGATEASVELEFTIADGQARSRDIVIPAGTEVRTEDVQEPVSFYTVADAVIVAGTIQVSAVLARNAEPQSDAFVGDGSADQEYSLPKTPFLDGSTVLRVLGVPWLLVDNLLDSGPTDKHYYIRVDENNAAKVHFGNGTNGLPPTGSIAVDYETGGGSAANVDPNTLTVLSGRFTDESGSTVQLLVRNPSAAGGGTDRMGVEEARLAIPAHVTTAAQLSISRIQFENNARLVRGVARALLLTSDERPAITEYTGNVYIVPVGGGLPSAALKADVLTMLTVTRPPPVGFGVSVLDPILKIISITATVYLEEGVAEADARTAIEDALDAFFALQDSEGNPNTLIDFGFHVKNAAGGAASEVPWSSLFNVVRDADGIRKVDKSAFSPASDVPLVFEEFPVLGSISLINGDTGAPF